MQCLSQTSAITILLLTSREAAKLLKISARTLWHLTASGQLPAVRIGRSVRYDLEDLQSFVNRRKGCAAVVADARPTIFDEFNRQPLTS